MVTLKYPFFFRRYGSQLLFISLLLIFLLPLVISLFPSSYNLVLNIIEVIIVLAGINVIRGSNWFSKVGEVLGLITFVMILLATKPIGLVPFPVRVSATSVFLLYLTLSLFLKLLKHKDVDYRLMIEAMCAYLLIGFSGSIVFRYLYSIDNSMFLNTTGFGNGFTPIYYSFITMTTVGYGDIQPTHPISQGLAVLLSLSGIFYTTIILAIIVSKFITRRDRP